jgi:hypothetical protein
MPHYETESDFAVDLRGHLEDEGWVVYPEICGIDLVGVSPDQRLYAIETKMKFGAAVMQQCWKRLPYANAVVAATCRYPERGYSRECAKVFGIGLWTVNHRKDAPYLKTVLPPVQREIQDPRVKNLLQAAAINHTLPGKPSCTTWNEWDALQEKYVEFLTAHGPSPIALAISVVEPQYKAKRVLVRQPIIESRSHLIECRRWRKLSLAGITLSLKDVNEN